MAKIERIELYHISIPLKHPFFPAWIPGYPQRENNFTLLRIFTSDGIEGVSAGPCFSKEREGLGKVLGPFLLGMEGDNVDLIRKRLRELSYLGWRNPWVEPAFWDIMGKLKGLPVYKVINEGKEDVLFLDVYASSGELKNLKERVNYCERILEMGIKAVKLRVHSFKYEEDEEIVKGVRKNFGDKLKLMVDANQGWPVSIVRKPPVWDYERALRFAQFCAENGVEWLEEPLDMNDYDNLAQLKKTSPVKIAGAELSSGWNEVKILMEKDCYHIYQPDATLCGGIHDSVKIMKECIRRGLEFTPHTWTNGIGFLINLHVLAGSPFRLPIEYPYEPPSFIPEVRDGVLESPILVEENGKVRVPQIPGLGIKLSEKALKKFGKIFYRGTKFRIALSMIKEKGLKKTLEMKRLMEEKEKY